MKNEIQRSLTERWEPILKLVDEDCPVEALVLYLLRKQGRVEVRGVTGTLFEVDLGVDFNDDTGNFTYDLNVVPNRIAIIAMVELLKSKLKE